MSRRTGEQTRALLIETGMQMLLDRGITAGVSHIRLQEVVRRAGLTTGAAYRLWTDQDDYHRDLAVAVARWRADRPVTHTRQAIDDVLGGDAGLDEVVRIGAAEHIGSITPSDTGATTSSRLFLVALALRATSQARPELQAAGEERHADSVAEFAALYAAVMRRYGLRMRSPLTIEQFSVAMAALGEGFALQAIQGIPHPTVTSAPGGTIPAGEWTVFGLAIRGLIQAFMEFAPDDDSTR